jgi:hypothetical protein
VARLAIRFVPVTGRGRGQDGRSLDWLAYYHDQKLLLRFTRQPGLIPAEASGAA